MQEAVDKLILLLLGIALCIEQESFLVPVIVVLIAMIYLGFSLYFSEKRIRTGFIVVLCLLVFLFPILFFFLPLAVYDIARDKLKIGLAAVLFAAAGFFSMEQLQRWQMVILGIGMVLAVILAVRTSVQLTLYKNLIVLRDNSIELRNTLLSRQQELMEKQDQEVRLATLQERNRIAREIHDHVGHMLSRSILQMAALMTIYKEEPLHTQLEGINHTLNEAMNNIRESVHDLHDESLDLKQSILEALSDLEQRCEVHFDYDMTENIPRGVKYCLISIVKEAVSNIIRHSSGDCVNVLLREHPAFYQMVIEDNGGQDGKQRESGIGLSNMKERVEALQGQIYFSGEAGFKILVSLPKKLNE